MKVIMVYPNPSQHSPSNFTPLSILFAGAFYELQGNQVEYFDMRFDNEKELERQIMDSDMIGVSSMSGSQLIEAIKIMKRAKEIKPSIRVVLGGPHAKMLPEQCMKEKYITEVYTEDVGMNMFPFNHKTKRFFKPPFTPIWLTSTGCPSNCGFCKLEKIWKPREINQVLGELSSIHTETKFKKIDLCDANICMNTDRLKAIGKWMKNHNAEYHTNIRCDYLTKEVCKVLDEGNCRSLELGCESGSDRILKDIINKGHDVKAIKTAIKNLSKTSISPMCSFMVGVPTETKEDIIKSMDLVDWIMKTHPKARCSFYTYIPYPKTSMLELAKKYQGYKEPKDLEGWSRIKPMATHPLYWIAGLCFRKENTAKNFPGEKRKVIAPYEKLAEECWKKREWDSFPTEQVEKIITGKG